MLIPILQNRGDRIFWRKGTLIAREMRFVRQDLINEWVRGLPAENWWMQILDLRPVDDRVKEHQAEQRRKTRELREQLKKQREEVAKNG